MKPEKKTRKQQTWKKKYPRGKACFAWEIDDYEVWGLEPPTCLLDNPLLTEGQIISQEELENWFMDSIKTLKVLKETDSKNFQKIYQGFILDIKYLHTIKRIEKESLDFVLDKNNFEF